MMMKKDFQKGDWVQGMKIEKIKAATGVITLSMEDLEFEVDETDFEDSVVGSLFMGSPKHSGDLVCDTLFAEVPREFAMSNIGTHGGSCITNVNKLVQSTLQERLTTFPGKEEALQQRADVDANETSNEEFVA